MGKIFVSYRRKDVHFVHRLVERLETSVDASIITDQKISDDDFPQFLLREISECNVFILVVSSHTFAKESIFEELDWIRREVKQALDYHRNCMLVVVDHTPIPSVDELPKDIQGIIFKHGIRVYSDYFNDGIRDIANHCSNISKGIIKLRSKPLSSNIDEVDTSPSPKEEVNISLTGDSNHQTTYYKSTIHQTDNTVQDARARIVTLKEERDKRASTIKSLEHAQSDRPSRTMEGLGCYVVTFAFVLVLAAVINPGLGVVFFVLASAVFIFRIQQKSNESQSRKSEIAKNQHVLRSIEREIEDQLKIINGSHKL